MNTPSPWPRYLAYGILVLLFLFVGFALFRSCQPVKQPQDEYGNSTIDTRRETKNSQARQDSAARAKVYHQQEAQRLYNLTREKAPTPVTPAAVHRADSNILTDIGRR